MSSKGRVSKAGLAALNKELYGHIYSCRKTLRRLLTFGSHRQLCGFSFTILPFHRLSLSNPFPSRSLFFSVSLSLLASLPFVSFLFLLLFSAYKHKRTILFLSIHFLIFSPARLIFIHLILSPFDLISFSLFLHSFN